MLVRFQTDLFSEVGWAEKGPFNSDTGNALIVVVNAAQRTRVRLKLTVDPL